MTLKPGELRKIVKGIGAYPWGNKTIASLIHALVEEREHSRRLKCDLPVLACNKNHKQEALCELDIDDVWPPKETS